MTDKKPEKASDDQYQRFLKKVREMEDAGELNPTEAEERFERAVSSVTRPEVQPKSNDSGQH